MKFFSIMYRICIILTLIRKNEISLKEKLGKNDNEIRFGFVLP